MTAPATRACQAALLEAALLEAALLETDLLETTLLLRRTELATAATRRVRFKPAHSDERPPRARRW